MQTHGCLLPRDAVNGPPACAHAHADAAGNLSRTPARAAAEWSINNGTLRELVFSHNPQLAGNISAWSLPRSLQALHIANTSIAGSLDGDWLSRQGPVLDCLVGYSTPGLCGGLVEGLPCSIVNFTDGTALGECGMCLHGMAALGRVRHDHHGPMRHDHHGPMRHDHH